MRPVANHIADGWGWRRAKPAARNARPVVLAREPALGTPMLGVDRPGYEELSRAYADGRFLDGKEVLDRWAPALDAEDAAVRLLVHRLFNQLGLRRRAVQILFRLWRDAAGNPEVIYYVALSKLERRGLWHAFQWTEAHKSSVPMNHLTYPAYTALRARLYSQFRDFQKAHELLDRASRGPEAPGDPFLLVEAASVFLAQDRPQDAVAAARQAGQMRPNYLPAIMAEADARLRLREDQEALELVQGHVTRVQSPHLAARLVELCLAQELFEKASDALQLVEVYGRHAEPAFQQWVNSQRSLVAYRLGRFEESRNYALRVVDSEWHQNFAAKLASLDAPVRRVQLAVPYVPQHHLTCAPATLAALSHYWGKQVDQEEIAAAICYDGTPEYEERTWIEQQGFLAREFRADWVTTKALIDAGIPFAVVATFPRYGHLQAVIGYDAFRETLLVRDPGTRGLVELVAKTFFDEQRPYGPRGLALAPSELRNRLFALEMPEADAYEHAHRFGRALSRNDRETAGSTLAKLRETHGDADLTLALALRLAQYDLNWPAANEHCQQLVERYPNALRWRVQHLHILRQLRNDAQLRRTLESLCGKAHPEFWIELADRWLADDTRAGGARLLLLRALRYAPAHPLALGNLARYHYARQELELACLFYRLAAASDDKDESWFLALFRSARQLGRQDAVVSRLKARAEENLPKSIQPLRTACEALVELDRTPAALALVNHALETRPEDAPLQLFAAETFAGVGDLRRAEALLASIHTGVREAQRQRTWARVAKLSGNREEAKRHLEAALEFEPGALDLHDQLAELWSETAGPEAAAKHFHAAWQKFPFNVSLLERLVGWTHQQNASQAEGYGRQLLELSPANAWAHREMARILLDLDRASEALGFARQATVLERSNANAWFVLGTVHKALQQRPEATAAFWDALDRDLDHTPAIAELLDEARPFNERAHHAEQLFGRFMRGPSRGLGIREWHTRARGLFSDERLLDCLHQLHARHAGLWQTWSTLIHELLDERKFDVALNVAERACARFPLNAEIWFDRARCHYERKEDALEIEALQRILQISPNRSQPRRRLAGTLERIGRLDEAEQSLREAVRREPGDAYNRGCLADLLWKRERREEAYAELWRALQLNPGYEWGWDQIERWPGILGKSAEALQQTRAFISEHPERIRPVLSLLAQLDARGPAGRAEALPVAADLVARRPRAVPGHDWLAYLLAREQRYEEALQACAPPVFEGRIPAVLQARCAWVEWQAQRPAQAIESMLQAVKADPNNAWNFEQLTRWALDSENGPVAVYAAGEWVKLRPGSAEAWYLRGKALAGSPQGDQANAAYRRAFELGPGHEAPALALLEGILRSNQDPEPFLSNVEKTHSRPFVASCRCMALARTASGSGQTAKEAIGRALKEFETVCTDPTAASRHIQRAAQALAAARAETALARKACDLAFQAQPLPGTAEVWVKHARLRDLIWRLRLHPRPLPAGEATRRVALRALLERAGETRCLPLLQAVVRRFRNELRGDATLYGTVGFALVRLRRYAAAVRWLRDHASHPDLQPWMLWNLAVSLLIRYRADEAWLVTRRALDLPADHTTNQLRSVGALILAGKGEWEAARSELDRIHRQGLKTHARAAALLAELALRMQERFREHPPKRGTVRQDWQRLQARVDEELGADTSIRTSPLTDALFREGQRALDRLARQFRVPTWPLRRPRKWGGSPFRSWGSGRRLFAIVVSLSVIIRACSHSHFDDRPPARPRPHLQHSSSQGFFRDPAPPADDRRV